MTRARLLKPGFFLNEQLAELPYPARILFEALWCIADRAGRLDDRPKRIKHEALPYDDENVDDLLQKLHDGGFIVRYSVEGTRYIQVVNFSKHQSPHIHEAKSVIPAPGETPEEHSTSTVQAQYKHDTRPSVPIAVPIPNPKAVTPTVDAAAPSATISTLPVGAFAPAARSTTVSSQSSIALPERLASDTTERAYWERVMKDLPSAQRLPTLVSLAHDKIGADDAPGCATYGRLGQLARKHTASLVAVWIIQAAGQHIAGDPLDYLTKLAAGQIGRTAQRAQAAADSTRPTVPTMIPASEADRWWESLPHDAPVGVSSHANQANTRASAPNGGPARQSKPPGAPGAPGALGSAAQPPKRAADVIDLTTVRVV